VTKLLGIVLRRSD